MSSARADILARVREALRAPTDPHVRRAGAAPPSGGGPSQWLPSVGDSYENRAALFAELSEKLKTTLLRVPDRAAAVEELKRVAGEEGWRRVGYHDTQLVTPAVTAIGVESVTTDGGYARDELEACDAGVTGCDALVAQTGSILLSTRSAGGRALSVLPPHHVAIATRDQLIADLPAAFALLRERYAANWPSFMTLVTGPSRTGDIERILVLGAHGPKRLTVILIEE